MTTGSGVAGADGDPLQRSSPPAALPLAGAKSFRVVPVLDLLGGCVVRGVAGRRHEYRPIVSGLTPSSKPADVATAIRDRFALSELYFADLDALTGAPPAVGVYEELHGLGFALWVDAGLRRADDATTLGSVARPVAGLETLAGPAELRRLVERFGDRVVFSLDLRGGEPLGDRTAWRGGVEAIAGSAIGAGVRGLIALDLARVGMSGGTGTEALCARLAAAHPEVEVFAGGGVRGPEDLRRLRDGGTAGVLVASALHDGRFGADELRRCVWR
jgi:phosphoribosylformimino-5-aminoimidazole carboxamide ribotide isomerase